MAALQPLEPGATIGILGGGQLGRMLALAAAKLGLKIHIYTDETNAPAAEVASRSTHAAFSDLASLTAFAATVDVVTYEFENVPVAAARHLETMVPVRPGAQTLAAGQDRLTEKQFLRNLGIPVAPFAAVDDAAALADAIATIGMPSILKTRLLGYDGKGQVRIRTPQDIDTASGLAAAAPAVLEGFVPFTREISVIAVRGMTGSNGSAITFYDSPENTHEAGVLRQSVVPASISAADKAEARRIARTILEALDYVGVLAVEFFHIAEPPAGSPSLIVNEIAPRVHNSGHWTMDACAVDQFENHIRAIAGWPLGSTERHSDVVMRNLIGAEANDWHALLDADPHVSLHLYGKDESRPGRKMGHVNRLTPKS